jgi:hypothetical protein
MPLTSRATSYGVTASAAVRDPASATGLRSPAVEVRRAARARLPQPFGGNESGQSQVVLHNRIEYRTRCASASPHNSNQRFQPRFHSRSPLHYFMERFHSLPNNMPGKPPTQRQPAHHQRGDRPAFTCNAKRIVEIRFQRVELIGGAVLLSFEARRRSKE